MKTAILFFIIIAYSCLSTSLNAQGVTWVKTHNNWVIKSSEMLGGRLLLKTDFGSFTYNDCGNFQGQVQGTFAKGNDPYGEYYCQGKNGSVFMSDLGQSEDVPHKLLLINANKPWQKDKNSLVVGTNATGDRFHAIINNRTSYDSYSHVVSYNFNGDSVGGFPLSIVRRKSSNGNNANRFYHIASDSKNNIYLAGYFNADTVKVGKIKIPARTNKFFGLLIKLSPQGDTLWTKQEFYSKLYLDSKDNLWANAGRGIVKYMGPDNSVVDWSKDFSVWHNYNQFRTWSNLLKVRDKDEFYLFGKLPSDNSCFTKIIKIDSFGTITDSSRISNDQMPSNWTEFYTMTTNGQGTFYLAGRDYMVRYDAKNTKLKIEGIKIKFNPKSLISWYRNDTLLTPKGSILYLLADGKYKAKYGCFTESIDFKGLKINSNGSIEAPMIDGGVYRWYLNGIELSGNGNVFSPSSNGTFTVKIAFTCAGCRSVQLNSHEAKYSIEYRLATITDEQAFTNLSVYPNPTENEINLLDKLAVETILVYSSSGTKIMETPNPNFPLLLGHLNSGVYLLIGRNKQGVVVLKEKVIKR